jgi:hypothetical protein
MKRESKWRALALGTALAAAAAFGCGGGGGGGGGGSSGGTATISGGVTNASTSEKETAKTTWLARLGEEMLGLAKRAYAAATVDTSLDGITVTVSEGSIQAASVTDNLGDFAVDNAPTGDVTVAFSRGNCRASVSLPDVADGSAVQLQNTTVDCNAANPGKIEETFQGVLEHKPASPNGNLNVCAFGGGGNHVRAVNTDSSTQFEDANGGAASFGDLQDGDLIEATGQREGVGSSSTLVAATVKRIASGHTDQCKNIATPTPVPTSTPTPEPTATP